MQQPERYFGDLHRSSGHHVEGRSLAVILMIRRCYEMALISIATDLRTILAPHEDQNSKGASAMTPAGRCAVGSGVGWSWLNGCSYAASLIGEHSVD
jgi:hypothetical protein